MLCPSCSEQNLREVLFLKETDDRIAVWEGPKLNKKQAFETSGINSVFWLDEMEKIIDEVMQPTMKGLINEGSPYLGFLYAGLMINDGELKVLEFNCRFGDPETQPILLRLKSSLVELCKAAIDDELDNHKIEWTKQHACGVVIASAGYPENYTKNNEVSIQATDIDGTKLFHAGTKLDQDKIYTSGGRVFCATALGDDLKEAQQKAYNLVESVDFEGAFFRKDIGNKGLK